MSSRAAGAAANPAPVVCRRCEFQNPPEMNFCGACGAPLEIVCTACGMGNPPRFRFCGGCGSPLVWTGPRLVPDTPVASLAPARQQLTVMFCDLVGYTTLSLHLDPEELRDLLRSYQSVCAQATEQFDGYIAQYLGDGVLVYFGYPRALENEAEHAVRAGLSVIAGMERLNARLDPALGIELAVRIGIHTGLVVVGEVGGGARRENLALGGTPNIAARLQTLAEPNTVVISAVTQRLVARHFHCEDLGAASLTGVAGIGSVFRVIGERVRPRTTHRTPLVGRTTELTILAEAWREASGGGGQALLFTGDAGVGKSHLIDEFVGGLEAADHVVLECSCQPYYTNTAFHPFISWLERELGRRDGQSPEQMLLALDSMLERDGFDVAESLPLFASLLQLPFDVGEFAPSPQARREMTRAALIRMILRSAEHSPAVLLIEDVHWADPSTLDLLELLVPQLRRHAILTLFTARPGFASPWSDEHVTRIDLGRLPQGETQRIILHVAGKPFPPEVVEQIVTKADGIPLFAEELSRMVVQSGLLAELPDRYALTGPLPPFAIPATLKDSLEARLDRLHGVKELAQLGATIGREFSFALLRAAAVADEVTLKRGLAELVEAGLIREEEGSAGSRYVFRHALIQEAAYESLLRSTRQWYHQRIAEALERYFPETAETEPETLAHHWTAADQPEHAVAYWMRAGLRAQRASASQEARAHLERGIELLPRLIDELRRTELEIELQAALGGAVLATEGYASPHAKAAFDRARELTSGSRDISRLGPILTGIFAYYLVRNDLATAWDVATELDHLARETGLEESRLIADTMLGIASVTRGNIREGRVYLERVNACYDPERHAPLALRYGHDLGVLALAYTGWLLWLEGKPIQSRAVGDAAIQLARSLQHPHSMAFALAFIGSQHRLRGDVDAAAAITDELLPLAIEWRFGHWHADAVMLQAWVLAERGQLDAAQERLNEAVHMLGAHDGWRIQFYSLMRAHVLAALGRSQDALALLTTSRLEDERAVLTVWASEQREWMGLLMAKEPGREAEAEAWLRDSLDHALNCGALMPSLRAATALGELLHRRGRTEEAERIVAPVYAQFTEGHELRDLRAAARLLSALRTQHHPSGSAAAELRGDA